jgi:hypothetical protein
MGRRWTEHDIAALRRMAQQYPVPRIAEIMDRTVGGVTFKAHELKLALRPIGINPEKAGCGDPGPAGFDWSEPESLSIRRTR